LATILVTTRTADTGPNGPLAALHQAGHTVRHTVLHARTPAAEVAQAAEGCVAAIVGGERYDAEVFRLAPQLRHVARFGAGYDAIDVDAATAAGVMVSNSPGANAIAVADLTLGLILSIARSIPTHDRNIRQGVWQSRTGADVWQQTLGIVGLGRIGQGVARRARGFDMRILAYEPFPNQQAVAELGVELAPIERVFSEADFVTLHLPASAETDGLVDARLLGLMKPSAFFINAARGKLVDEDALFATLQNRKIAGAAIDVRRDEPPLDTRFNELDNIVMTPHTAAATPKAQFASGQMAAESVLKVLSGQQPIGFVNPEVWDRVVVRR
jgi:D-3-phosphoglycerate dehydrogenase